MQRGVGTAASRKPLFALLAVLALAATALLFLPGGGNTSREGDDSALEVDSRSCEIPAGSRFLKPGLKLAKGDPVHLVVTFLSADGNPLDKYESSVKGSNDKRISIPQGAHSAKLDLRKRLPADQPQVHDFKPTFVPAAKTL